MNNKNIVVWFSCGAASAVAAKKTIEIYGVKNNVSVVNTPVYNEHPDNKRFLKDVERWLGINIKTVINPEFPSSNIIDVFNKRKYMSGVHGAVCTGAIKKEARYIYEKSNRIDFHVLGFTVDEWQRQKKFKRAERNNVIPVLVTELITKEDCFDILKKEGIKIPEIYSLGYPNANCIGCVKSSSPTYWNLVRNTFPDVYQERALQSRDLGVRLVKRKGVRIYLDQLKPTDKGGKIKTWDCGIFCNVD